MPSIALFIKELLSEDKYSSDYSDGILERAAVMNAAQLQGIYNHLQLTSKTSKCNLWMEANTELMSRIENILKEKTIEQQKITKIIEEGALKEQQKIKKVIENNREKKRVMRMIVENARMIAIQEVKENEMKRQSDEKLEIIQKVFQGEERRNKWWKISAASFVVSIVLMCIFIKNMYILLAGIILVIIVTCIAVYKAYRFTDVLPRIVDESELELEITKKEEVLKKKAVSILKEKEKKFQEQLMKDKIDKKKRKALKRNSLLFEQKLMFNRSKTQKDMASEAATFHIYNNNNIATNKNSFIVHNNNNEDIDIDHVVLYAEAKTSHESNCTYLEDIEEQKGVNIIIIKDEDSSTNVMITTNTITTINTETNTTINQNNIINGNKYNINNINTNTSNQHNIINDNKYNTITNESLVEDNYSSLDNEVCTNNDIENNLMDK